MEWHCLVGLIVPHWALFLEMHCHLFANDISSSPSSYYLVMWLYIVAVCDVNQAFISITDCGGSFRLLRPTSQFLIHWGEE